MNGKDLLIVIPAYNEEANLGKVLEALAAPEIAAHADVLVRSAPEALDLLLKPDRLRATLRN